MLVKEELISKIIALEWEMFQNVTNIGGKTACQNNYETFNIMRYSQTISWSEAALDSYLEDLAEAKTQGRNLLTEKYARMMEFTSPLEYAQIQQYLQPLEQKKLLLINKIIAIHMTWTEELNNKIPQIRKYGRPTFTTSDNQSITSIETYMRGELATYSLRTLELYYEHISEQKRKNINGAQIIIEAMLQGYGRNFLAITKKAEAML